MLWTRLLCFNLLLLVEKSFAEHIQQKIRAGRVQPQGVNLGAWLITEHWMSKASDMWLDMSEAEANSGEQLAMTHTNASREVMLQRVKHHRETFITEHDIAAISQAGLNTVRVPVGYWVTGFDNHDPSGKQQYAIYAPHSLDYLDTLIKEWAKVYNVAVLISMHGAKGSQNGAEHSSPEVQGSALWAEYPENIASTLDAVAFLADRYKYEDAFLGIGLLNEPSGSTTTTALYQYYQDAYQRIRVEGQNDCILTIAPLLTEQSPQFMTDVLPGATNVWVEWHRYFVWGFENYSEQELLTTAMDNFQRDLEDWQRKSDKKMFIGEFSFATPGNLFQEKKKLAAFGKKQMQVLQAHATGGWTFWSWRIDGDEDGDNLSAWSLRNLIRNTVFPALT